MSKNSGVSKHGHTRDSKYPLESGGGGWGLSVFHKYFLVIDETLNDWQFEDTFHDSNVYESFLLLFSAEVIKGGCALEPSRMK